MYAVAADTFFVCKNNIKSFICYNNNYLDSVYLEKLYP